MNILLIDSSTSYCHITIKINDKFVTINSNTSFDHTEHLLLLIDSSLKTLHCRISDIDYLICGTGPGSFTGIRISHSLIKGLFFESKTLILPVPTISLFSFSIYLEMVKLMKEFDYNNLIFYSLIFGKKNRFYFAKYNFCDKKDMVIQFLKPEILDIPAIEINKIIEEDSIKYKDQILILDDINSLGGINFNKKNIIKSEIYGNNIVNYFENNFEKFKKSLVKPEELQPLYLRKSDAEESI